MDPLILVESPHTRIYTFTAIIFAVFMAWEALAPRRALSQNMVWRWMNNFTLSALTWYISVVLGTWFLLWLAGQVTALNIGLLQQSGASMVTIFFVFLLLTQFVSYWLHRAFHHYSWLWPIHAVHHSDVDVDISTSYRHHPLEPLIGLPIAGPVVLILGAPMEVVAAYRLFEVAATVFSHSNIRIPQGLEKVLRWLILTPDFHRLHHCSQPHFTNSNYGSLVPWFDYLLGTARQRPYAEQETMELGLEYLRSPRDGRVDQLLLIPARGTSTVTAP